MKKLFFYLLIFSPILSFAQWQVQTVPTTANLFAVNYLNANDIFIGRYTYFHVTTDGGTTWVSPNIRDLSNTIIPASGFTSVHFFNGSNGVATGPMYTGNSRVMLSTSNGGYNWGSSYVSNSGPYPRAQDELFFPSTSIGYSTGTNGVILKSTDGGVSWFQQTSGTVEELLSVYFTTNTIGYTCGHNIILHTTDGGNNWISTSVVGDIQKIWFANDSTGYAAGVNGGPGVFYKTTDYGVTWTSIANPFYSDVYAIAGHPNDTLYVCSNNRMYYTMNGGIYWSYFPITVGHIINDIDFIPNTDSAYAVGNNGYAIKTINGGGNSFAPVSTFTASITSVCEGNNLSFTNLGDPTWSFQWLLDNTVVSTSYNSTIIFPTVGNHLVQLISYNGYAYDTTGAITINVNPLPAITGLVTQVGTNPICVNSSSTIQVLTSQPGVVYQLRNGITQVGSSQNGNNGTLTFNTGVLSSTTGFNIYATMTNGCGSVNDIRYDTINVDIVNQFLQVLSQQDSVCSGTGTNIILNNSISGVIYKLRKNTTVVGSPQTGNGGSLSFPTGNITVNTTYNILATDPTGCFAQETQTVLIHVISVTANISLPYNLLQIGDTLNIPNTSSGSIYAWNFGANANPATSNSTTPSVSFSTSGIHTITLQVTSNPGCIAYDTAYVTACQFPSVGSGIKCWDKDYSYRSEGYYANPGYKILDYCTDIHGNSYATGYYDSVVGWGTSYNMIILKFDSVGNLVWQHKQNPWSYAFNDYRSSFGTSIAADDFGNFYVGGSYAGSHLDVGSMVISSNADNGYEKPFLIKFDSNGNPLWNFIAYLNSTNGTKGGAVTDIAVRNSNNIYFAIGGDGTYSMGFHYADGSAHYGNDFLNIIHIDGNGGYISNTTATNSNTIAIPFYCVFNPNISAQNSNLETYTSPKIAIVSDTLYVGLLHFASMDFGSITIAATQQFNATNGLIAKMNLNTAGWLSVFKTFSNDIGAQGARPIFTVNNSGNVFVAWNWNASPTILYLGNQTYAPNPLVTFIAKYSTSGNVIWADVSNSDMHVNSLSYLEASNQLISYGLFGNPIPYYGFLNATSQSGGPYGFLSRGDHDIFLSSYSNTGDVNWIRHIGGSGYDNPFFMRSFNCEQVGLIGQSDSTSLFDNDTIASYPTGNIFVAKFSATGNCGMPNCNVPITYASANASIPTLCSGNCTPLNFFFTGGTPPFSYLWMPGNLTSASPSVCPNTTTTYTCTITDANNFTQSASTTVTVNASPVVTFDLSPVDTQCVSINTITLPVGSPAGGTYSGPFVTGNTFSPSSAGYGTYSISYSYTGANGCFSSASDLIFVDLCSGIASLTENNSIQLYPNPVSGMLTIDDSENSSISDMKIYNSVGEIVFAKQYSENKITINMAGFENGVYYLKIESGESSVVRKIVKIN